MSIKIVTDSTISIDKSLVEKLAITIVPLSYSIEGVIYQDGDLSLEEYLKELEKANELPKTSQPPIGKFVDIYEELTKDGSQVVSIHLSSTLSGTVDAARQAAMLVGAEKVHVLDSEFTDQALAFQVIEAARLAQEDQSIENILKTVEHIKNNTDLYCGVVTLENLVKGGRIGRVSGIIGNFLDIRLILQMKDNKLESFMKGRGAKTFKKFVNEISNSLMSSGKKIREIGISHAENLEFAKNLRDVFQNFVEKPILILDTNTIVATHTGRGAFALMISYE